MSRPSIIIEEIAHYLPENIISNQDLIDAESLKIKAEWVEKRIGITERRWANDNQSASDLAYLACQKLNLKNFKGAIWVSTISGDYSTPLNFFFIEKKT